MEVKIPEHILELAKQMNESPTRCTAEPFWQVRTYEYLPTEQGCDEHHWVLCCEEHGEFFRSDKDDYSVAFDFLAENYQEFVLDERLERDSFTVYDLDRSVLPNGITKLHLQEVEKVVWTGLSEAAALQFIARKKHDYGKLFTYVESAYWSPQFAELMNWVKSLEQKKEK
jgi:hypothetical protein